MPSWLIRVLRLSLVGIGSITVTSAVVNIIGAVKLIEPSDEAALGVTQGEVISWFIGPLLFGIALIVLGLWRWQKPKGPK